MILRSCFGFCLQIPANFYDRSQVYKHACVYDVIYNKKSACHYERFNFFYSLSDYFNFPELIMRGVFILKSDQAECHRWRYLQTEHLNNSNALASKLLSLRSKYPQFNDMLYGKKDSFFHNVPLECLKKFFDHLEMSEFEAIILEHCHAVGQEAFEAYTTHLGRMYSSRKVLDSCKKQKCYYIEDYLDNKEFAQKMIPRLTKSEVIKTMQIALKRA